MTRLALAIGDLGELLRERLQALREKGQMDTDYFRRLRDLYVNLGALVNFMIAIGEVDPKIGEEVRHRMAPELRKLKERGEA